MAYSATSTATPCHRLPFRVRETTTSTLPKCNLSYTLLGFLEMAPKHTVYQIHAQASETHARLTLCSTTGIDETHAQPKLVLQSLCSLLQIGLPRINHLPFCLAESDKALNASATATAKVSFSICMLISIISDQLPTDAEQHKAGRAFYQRQLGQFWSAVSLNEVTV